MIPTELEMQAALVGRQGSELCEKLKNTTVAVCGLGGLGSNIALSLARAGVSKLIICDFDRVDVSNLHRQQYDAAQTGMYKTDAMQANLLRAVPYIMIEAHNTKLNADNIPTLLSTADIICEAFDDAEAKAMLVDTVLEKLPGKYLIAASGMAGLGSADDIHTRKITDRFFICGDGTSDVADGIGLVAPRVMLCAAHQALAVIRIIAGEM